MARLSCLVTAPLRSNDPLMVPDGDFHPNVLNSIVFLLSGWMQINTFAVNYCGRPFTQALRDNVMFFYCLLGSWGVLFLLALDVIPFLRDHLQLVALPTDDYFQLRVIATLALNLGCTWSLEHVTRKLDA